MEENILYRFERVPHKRGYGCRIASSVFNTLIAVTFIILGSIFMSIAYYELEYESDDHGMLAMSVIELIIGIVYLAVTVLSCLGAEKGRYVKWGNTLSIIAGAIACTSVFGILGIVGGVLGNRALNNPETDKKFYNMNIEGYCEKQIERYAVNKYASAIVGVASVFVPITPFFIFGTAKYRKKNIITGCIAGTLWIVSVALLGVYAAKPSYAVKQVLREVRAGEGTRAEKQLVRSLKAMSYAHDINGFNAALNTAHDRYEARKDIILSKKEFNAKAEKLVIDCAVAEGREQAKQIKRQCKQLYSNRNFEKFTELCAEYGQKAEERKNQILSNATCGQVELEYDGKSTFDGKLRQRIGWTLLGNLVTIFTLGIAYPVAVCWKMRWQANHTVYNGKRLSFDGNGIQLMGKWILWGLLTVVTLGIYGLFVKIKLEQWKAKHTHIAGESGELGGTFDGKVLARFGINLLCDLLTCVTLGIAYPFAQCLREKWNKKHTVYDGRRLNFDGNGAQLIGKYILWWLLSVVTIGIYAQWVPIKLLKWKAEHTALSDEQECVI